MFFRALLIVSLTVVFWSPFAESARPTGLPDLEVKPEVFILKSPIEQAQEILKDLGYYDGPVNANSNDELIQAIRRYESLHGMAPTGKVTRRLLEHMENVGRVQMLIRRLDQVRKEGREEARKALMSNPVTRDLLKEKDDRVADPTRDVTSCFKAPDSLCLLSEAVESSRAVFEDDLRDWALGEILAAQVRAGLTEDALKTAARITDSRLVVAALSRIAKTHAREGNFEAALSSLDLIPDAERRVSVLLEIAKAHHLARSPGALESTLALALKTTESLEDLDVKLPFQTQIAVLMAKDDPSRALGLLEDISAQSEQMEFSGAQTAMVRRVAAAKAEIGFPEAALKVMDGLPLSENRVPILIAATRAFLANGRFEAASGTLERIDEARYRAVVMADAAMAFWQGDDKERALDMVMTARAVAESIKLPFARNFAVSKVADALIVIASETQEEDHANRAYVLLSSISDDRMRARGLWNLARAAKKSGFRVPGYDLTKAADQAISDIRSNFSRAWILGDLVREHTEDGDMELAQKALTMGLETARNLSNPWARSRALAKFGALIDRLH